MAYLQGVVVKISLFRLILILDFEDYGIFVAYRPKKGARAGALEQIKTEIGKISAKPKLR